MEPSIEHAQNANSGSDAILEFAAESPLRQFKGFIRQVCDDLLSARAPAYRLFKSAIAQRYRHSSLGLLWAFLPSAIVAAIVSLGQKHVPALAPIDISGQFYAIFGLILFQTLLETFNTQRCLFTANRHQLNRHRRILEASFLAGLLDNLFSLAVKLPILIGALILCGVHPASTVILGLFGILLVLAFGTTLGILAAPWNALRGDLNHVMGFFPWILAATTPVFVKPTVDSLCWKYYLLNPLTWVFEAVRNFFYGNATMGDGIVMLLVCSITFILLPVSWLICRIARPYVIERTKV